MADALMDSIGPTQLGRRPMIALLKAKSGMEDGFRALLIGLVRETRLEPGCVEFILLEELNAPGSFYLYEVYQDNAAFVRHLQSDTVARFKAALPSFSYSNQSKDLTQLVEISL